MGLRLGKIIENTATDEERVEYKVLKKIFEGASLLLPDGVGAVWALRWRYRLITERVPSVDLMQNICKESAEKGYRIFVYGAKEDSNRQAVEKLRLRPSCGVARFSKMLTCYVYAALFENRAPCLTA